nr:NADH dehydrogenase subunit 4L [Brachidontes pharaonis]
MKVFMITFFLLGVFITVSQGTHLISVFLGMEFITLSTIVVCAFSMFSMTCFVLLVMCMAVCEASLALALIVSMVRVSGSDQSFNLMLDKS